jgi:hypothetical protein
VFTFPNVFHFFAHKLARLSGRRFAFALIFPRAFNYFFVWHNKMVSPLDALLDANKKVAGFTSRRSFVPTEPVLSSALLTAALLIATLFFLLAPLTFTFLSVAILLSALLSRDVMRTLGVEESKVRQASAWAAEKVGRARLIIAGDEQGSLGLVLTLERLIMGVTGKKLMWVTLAAANLPRLKSYNFEELQRLAEQQVERIEAERISAPRHAFAGAMRSK